MKISWAFGLPPIENNLYATIRMPGGGTRRIKSASARAYAEHVGWKINASDAGGWYRAPGPLGLTIALYLKVDRDVSGNKCLQDAIAEALGFNDRIIFDLHVTKRVDKHETDPRAEVMLETL